MLTTSSPILRSTITTKRLGLASISTNCTPPWSRTVKLIHPTGISKVDKPMFTSELLFLLILFPLDDKWCLRQYGYVPFAVQDVSSTGTRSREASRTLEVGGERLYANNTITDFILSTPSRTLESDRSLSCWGMRMTLQSILNVHWCVHCPSPHVLCFRLTGLSHIAMSGILP